MFVDPHDALLDLIYEAAAEPALFERVLHEIAAITNSSGGLIEGFSYQQEYSYFQYLSGIDPDFKRLHQARFLRNPWADVMIHRPVGRVFSSDEIIELSELEKGAFYSEFLKPQQVAHSAMISLAARPDYVVAVTFPRQASQGPFERDELARIQYLVPHLRRASHLSLRLSGYRNVSRAEMDTLELLAQPVILLDVDKRCVFVNRSARSYFEGASQVLRWTGNSGITGGSLREAELLGMTIENALRGGPGGIVRLSHEDGSWFMLSVAPLRGQASIQLSDLGIGSPVVALFISAVALPPPSTFLCKEFNLTSTEARIAVAIGAGGPFDRIAFAHGISANTLKTHARRIYQKTGVRGQAELSRLLASLSSPLALPSPEETIAENK